MNGYTFAMGTVLKNWREQKNLTLSYIAERQNIKESQLLRLERGEEVESFILLDYMDEVHRIDPEFDVLKAWRQELGFEKRNDSDIRQK